MPTQPEIAAELQDFRQRVLQADRLRREGDIQGAEALLPSRDEIVAAVKAYRATLGQRAPAKAAKAAANAEANKIRTMTDLNDLFK